VDQNQTASISEALTLTWEQATLGNVSTSLQNLHPTDLLRNADTKHAPPLHAYGPALVDLEWDQMLHIPSVNAELVRKRRFLPDLRSISVSPPDSDAGRRNSTLKTL
jgi:hypothetical protein